jgi:hypothetical protein
MPHNGARDRQWLARTWLQGRSAEGVMVRRSSVASLDSGAESPVYGEEPSASAARGDTAAKSPWADGAVSPGGVISLQVPQGGATRDNAVTVDCALPGQVETGAPRLAASHDMSVVDRQSGKWYVKDIRASTQPTGNLVTWFRSSWAVPRGLRSPRKLTDVHGREG